MLLRAVRGELAVSCGVLGGITVVLYGMIGLLGAKIWKENKVDFGNPVNLVPVAAGIIIGIGDVSLQFSPEFTLGGITVVLYGMIGLLGAKIWKENGVDFANPINLVPVAAGIVIGIGDVKMKFSDSFTLSGIALGTIVAILAYHLAKAVAHQDLRDRADGTAIAVGDYTYGDSDGVDDLYQDGDPAAREREAGRRHNPGGPDSGRHRL